MDDLFLLLFLASFGCLITGLIKSAAFSPFIKGAITRKTIGLIFGVATCVFFVLFGLATDSQKANQARTTDRTVPPIETQVSLKYTGKQIGAKPPPQEKPVSLKTGMIYQSLVAVGLTSEVNGSVSQTIPADGYFRVASTQPDGWYEVVVSNGADSWTMWLNGATLSMRNLKEIPEENPEPRITAPQHAYRQPAPAPDTQSGAEADQVYITKTGKKFHRDGCQYLRLSRIPCSRADAQLRGCTPCSVCKP